MIMRTLVREYMVELMPNKKYEESPHGACVCLEFEENGVRERIIGLAPKLDTLNHTYGVLILNQTLKGNGEWAGDVLDEGCLTLHTNYVNPKTGAIHKGEAAYALVEVDYIDSATGLPQLELEKAIDGEGREILVPNTDGRTIKILDKKLIPGLIPQSRYYELGMGQVIFGAFKMMMKKYYQITA